MKVGLGPKLMRTGLIIKSLKNVFFFFLVSFRKLDPTDELAYHYGFFEPIRTWFIASVGLVEEVRMRCPYQRVTICLWILTVVRVVDIHIQKLSTCGSKLWRWLLV